MRARPTLPRSAPAGAAVVLGLLAVAGCGGSAAPQAGPSSAPPTSSPSPSSTPAPAAQLSALAREGAGAAYSAAYRLQASSNGAATVQVYRSPTALRLDIVSGGSRAVLVENVHGRYSCRLGGGERVCFRVADPGKTLPPEFDPGLQRVFTTYLTDLAANAGQYDVSPAPATDGGGVPSGQCFAVKTGSESATQDRAITGTYCLSDQGVVTKVSFPSGTLTLQEAGAAPTSAQLHPPVSPTPLPSAPNG